MGGLQIDSPKLDGNKQRKVLAIDPNESETVEKIFNLAVYGKTGKGLGVKSIANELNKNGLLKRNEKPWSINDVHRVLTNDVHYGSYHFRSCKNTKNEKVIIVKTPAIITKELFQKAKSAMKSRQLTNREIKGVRSPSLLTGVLKCKYCGANLLIMTGKSGKYEYYKCRNKMKLGNAKCKSPNIPKRLIEDAVIATLNNKLLDSKRIESDLLQLKKLVAKLSLKNKSKLLSLSKRSNKVIAKINNLWEKVSEDELLLDEYFKAHMESLKNENMTITREINFIKGMTTLPVLRFGKKKIFEFIHSMKQALNNKKESELLKSYILAVVDKIEVSSDKAIIKGSKIKLMDAISKKKMGTDFSVPTFVSIWR